MSADLNNLGTLVHHETVKVIRELLEAHLSDDHDEHSRQDQLAATIKKRNLQADDDPSKVDDVEEAEEDDPEETGDTGVPDPEVGEERREDRTGGKGTADSPKLSTPSEQQIDKASAKSVIDKLNALRGGKSLSDVAVRKSFDQYFKGLTGHERESLLVYITALAQILAGVVKGTEAIDPGDVGLRVTGDVEDTGATKDKRKKKAKADRRHVAPHPGSKEVPIVVGEQQQKRDVRQILEMHRKQS